MATALTDEEVSGVIAKSLPSCLLKLNSGTEGVRKKVLELLVHVNKRVKDNHNIQLPVDALLTQYQVCLTISNSVQAEFKKIGAPTFLVVFGLNFHMMRHFYL